MIMFDWGFHCFESTKNSQWDVEKNLTPWSYDVICGSKLRKNRFFRSQSKVKVISISKLKLAMVHLKTYIILHPHAWQTRTFWEWSREKICAYAFYYKIGLFNFLRRKCWDILFLLNTTAPFSLLLFTYLLCVLN